MQSNSTNVPAPVRAAINPHLAVFAVVCAALGITAATRFAPAPSVAGVYATRVTLVRDDCGGVKVEDNPTTVTHDTATSIVTFRHAGTTYGGKLAADSSFVTQPKEVTPNDGFAYTITLEGRFRANAFDAEATVDKTNAASKCRFVVQWRGTRTPSS